MALAFQESLRNTQPLAVLALIGLGNRESLALNTGPYKAFSPGLRPLSLTTWQLLALSWWWGPPVFSVVHYSLLCFFSLSFLLSPPLKLCLHFWQVLNTPYQNPYRYSPIVLAMWEAEARELHEHMSLSPPWASMGDTVLILNKIPMPF